MLTRWIVPATVVVAVVCFGQGTPDTFLRLRDTPDSYAGQALKGVRVNSTANALEFYTITAGATPTASPSATSTATPTATPTPTATVFVEIQKVTFVVDGAGIVLTTGTKNPLKTSLTFGGTLTGWTMMCKPSGSVTVDILRAADGAGLPVSSIVGGGTKPAIASDVESSGTSFSGWTSTTLTAKDNLAISLSGITSATYVELTLYYR